MCVCVCVMCSADSDIQQLRSKIFLGDWDMRLTLVKDICFEKYFISSVSSRFLQDGKFSSIKYPILHRDFELHSEKN